MRGARLVFAVCLAVAVSHVQASRSQTVGSAAMAMGGADMSDMEDMDHTMAAHMRLTGLRPVQPGDRARADALVTELRQTLAPYRDVRRAEADGFKPNAPGMTRRHYHFSRRDNFMFARQEFDPARPTSLLYDRESDGSFHLTGAMYTARRDASDAELDARVPLSIARWHEHLNLCMAPGHDPANYLGPHPQFGTRGSIATEAACTAAGGRFVPQLLGWMVHVHPFETDPRKVWDVMGDMN